jgi:hypothetical protein
MIVLALLGLILAAGWGLFSLTMKSWDVWQTRQEAEAAVRLTSQIITNELDYASFLEIRQGNHWVNNEANKLKENDRFIFVNDAGSIIISEFNGTSFVEKPLVEPKRCTVELSFSKPEKNPAGSGIYPDNILNYTITARYLDRDEAVIYSTDSSIMVSNMLPDEGVPISAISLYSQTDNCNPGDRIRYNTVFTRFEPSPPGGGFTCGL